jgi:adenylate kinase
MISFLGLPGTGKSWLAGQLKEFLRGTVVEGRKLANLNDQNDFRISSKQDREFAGKLREVLLSINPKNVIILDGIPRTLRQTMLLVAMCSNSERLKPAYIFSFELEWPEEGQLASVISPRLVCNACGATYDPEIAPPQSMGACDNCLGVLTPKCDLGISNLQKKILYQSGQIKRIRRYLKRQTAINYTPISVDIRNKQACLGKILAHVQRT